MQLAIGTGYSISGGAIGLHITRPASFAQPDYNNIVGGALSDLAFSGHWRLYHPCGHAEWSRWHR
ncbi:MAG: hypothetical protein U1F81_15600 [Verrucomicrobiaceae bacterium]